MAESRSQLIFRENIIPDKIKRDLQLEVLPEKDKVDIYYPICIGYSPIKEVDSNTKIFINGAIFTGYPVTLYLSPKDEASLQEWRALNQRYLDTLPKTVHVVSALEWRETKTYKDAGNAYKVFRNASQDVNDKIGGLIKKDVDAFAGRKNVELSEEERIEHVLRETITVISWLLQRNDPRVARLIIHESFSNSMFHGIQHASKMGYKEKSVVLLKVEVKKHIVAKSLGEKNEEKLPEVEEKQQEIKRQEISQKSDEMDQYVQLGKELFKWRVDAAWAAEYAAVVVKKRVSPTNSRGPVSDGDFELASNVVKKQSSPANSRSLSSDSDSDSLETSSNPSPSSSPGSVTSVVAMFSNRRRHSYEKANEKNNTAHVDDSSKAGVAALDDAVSDVPNISIKK